MIQKREIMNYSALIVAGGQGLRMGLGYNKVFFPLPSGQTVLDTTLNIFLRDENCTQIVIVTNQNDLYKIVATHEAGRIVNVGGGPTRQDSVYNGLMATKEEVVLIHDAARPWLSQECINDLLEVMETEDAAILGVKVKDTIKEVEDGYIVKTVDRSKLMHAQTPQAFKTKTILKAHQLAMQKDYHGTDDAQIIEHFNVCKIRVVEGSYANIKITTLDDVK